ncbi:hypothetical protein MKI84_08370 [Ancylobacter sp. A5.8]|uniref:hypothetical protein n=1 Tax=Ancylobacter gelatini TaxID=2919920 RepID=UPI001F4DDBFB|nr:hypothetical protein [Ancylobacter gelatini]MCJ8142929.1 hypothetical protein [Ancylobacter gelatini]
MRVALAQQIEEVGTTLEERRVEYSSKIARRQLGVSLADFRVRRLTAAQRTLEWLQRNEMLIRQRCPELFGGEE